MAATLPTELLNTIFQLSDDLNHESIGGLAGVCRNWRLILFDSPQLWTKLVLDASTVSPEGLQEKAKLWLSVPSSHGLEVNLVYGENLDMVLPMISYIMPVSQRWTQVVLTPPISISTRAVIWFQPQAVPFRRMRLVIGIRSTATTEDLEFAERGFQLSTRACEEGLQYPTFSLLLPSNVMRTAAIQPFTHVKSLSITCDPLREEDGTPSSCEHIIELLSSFPNLEILHLWTNHSPLELGPHDSPLLQLPSLVHLCVSQTLVCTLLHLCAPNLESFSLFLHDNDEDGHDHLPVIAKRLGIEMSLDRSYSGPGLVLRMLFLHCAPTLKKLDMPGLTATESLWIVNNLGSLQELRLTDSTLTDAVLQLISVGAHADGLCRLPRLSTLHFNSVEGFSMRSLTEMVRSRAESACASVARIRSLILETMHCMSDKCNLEPEYEELRKMLGDGYIWAPLLAEERQELYSCFP